MRQLTKEQHDFLIHINTEEFRELARKHQEADEAAMARAIAEREEAWARSRALAEQAAQERAEKIRPLKEALAAAGIKLRLSSYEGVWGEYQIGDGPEVDIDDDYLDTFGED